MKNHFCLELALCWGALSWVTLGFPSLDLLSCEDVHMQFFRGHAGLFIFQICFTSLLLLLYFYTTFTSLQRSQLALHGRCSWILASPRGDAWPCPSSCWRYTPANHVLHWAPTLPASHWARPLCPTDACRAQNTLWPYNLKVYLTFTHKTVLTLYVQVYFNLHILVLTWFCKVLLVFWMMENRSCSASLLYQSYNI